jgi:glycosyltransferase involved in cell wall biosynthesis
MRRNIGIYNLHMQAMGGGEKLTLVLAEHLSLAHNVWLFCAGPLDVATLERFLEVDLSRVTVVPLKGIGPLARVAAKIQGSSRPTFSLHHFLQLKKYNLDILINNSYASGLRCPAARGIFMCMFPHPILPHKEENLAQRIGAGLLDRVERYVTGSSALESVDSYSVIVAISQYSAEWIGRMWNRSAEVICPPCDDMGPPAPKSKMILHVGRFIADTGEDERHHKGQALMLEVFKRLTDLHRDGWELHFAGSIAPDKRSANFAKTIVQKAGGVPVFFHFNAAREEMRELYRRAAIYWHATGYGSDVNRYPAKQEHFGISTVEAMTAGAVPVVYASGGQREIVTDGVDGFWWEDIDGLIRQTVRLAEDAALRGGLAQEAVVSSKRFAKPAFAAQVDRVIAKSF